MIDPSWIYKYRLESSYICQGLSRYYIYHAGDKTLVWNPNSACSEYKLYIHTIVCWLNCQCYTCVHCYEHNFKTSIANLVNLSLGKSQTLSGSHLQKSLTKHKETLLSTLVFRLRFTKPQSKLQPKIHSPAQVWLQTLLCSSWHLNRELEFESGPIWDGWSYPSCFLQFCLEPVWSSNSQNQRWWFQRLGNLAICSNYIEVNMKNKLKPPASVSFEAILGKTPSTIYSGEWVHQISEWFSREEFTIQNYKGNHFRWLFFWQPKRAFSLEIKVGYCSQVIVLDRNNKDRQPPEPLLRLHFKLEIHQYTEYAQLELVHDKVFIMFARQGV